MNHDIKPILAIDIGGTNIKLALFDAKERLALLDKTSIPTRTEAGGVHILQDAAETSMELLTERGLAPADVIGAGIGIPGPVLTEGHAYVVNKCVNLGWDTVVQISKDFGELTKINKVTALNDANAAALGEYHASSLGDMTAKSAVVVTLGTGIGGGVILDGKVVPGAFGAAGEIGHIPVCPTHPLMDQLAAKGVATSGDLEYYASATGIVRVGRAIMDSGSGDLSAKDILDAAKAGDELAGAVCDFCFDTLGIGLAAVSGVMDPVLYIIGGGVSAAGEYLLNGIHDAFVRHVFHASAKADFQLARLGNDAGLYGAAMSAL